MYKSSDKHFSSDSVSAPGSLPELKGGGIMLTLKVHGQFITWPDDFAQMMMKYYQLHGVSFTVHANSVNPGWDAAKSSAFVKVEGAI